MLGMSVQGQICSQKNPHHDIKLNCATKNIHWQLLPANRTRSTDCYVGSRLNSNDIDIYTHPHLSIININHFTLASFCTSQEQLCIRWKYKVSL
eukprot:766765-Hanusia_phi.AAC.5